MKRPLLPRPQYGCRVNSGPEIGSLLVDHGAPRREAFCPGCASIQRGYCCLRTSTEAIALMRALQLLPPEPPKCRSCGRPYSDLTFKTCPTCRARARERRKQHEHARLV